jgi:hypothetical protein
MFPMILSSLNHYQFSFGFTVAHTQMAQGLLPGITGLLWHHVAASWLPLITA